MRPIFSMFCVLMVLGFMASPSYGQLFPRLRGLANHHYHHGHSAHHHHSHVPRVYHQPQRHAPVNHGYYNGGVERVMLNPGPNGSGQFRVIGPQTDLQTNFSPTAGVMSHYNPRTGNGSHIGISRDGVRFNVQRGPVQFMIHPGGGFEIRLR